MSSPCIREASEACFHGCSPFAGLPGAPAEKSVTGAAAFRHDFLIATSSSLHPNSQFTNHESLPSLHESFSLFTNAFPQYEQTEKADEFRANEYHHLSAANHVCLDYTGHGLFSYLQKIDHLPATSIASSSSHPPPSHSSSLESPFLEISYKSVNLGSQILHGVQESEIESRIRERIMAFMNVSETDYAMFFTANQSSAFKLLAESYSFHSNADLLTVYDHENEAVELMLESARKRGAHTRSAEFLYPRMRIRSEKLRKMIIGSKRNRRRRGLFVFPLQSRITGAPYSYSWMRMAQEEGWRVLLDASALRPKDMDTLGLSLFKPDFLICSFYKESAQEGISQRSSSGLFQLQKNDIISGMAPKEMYYGSPELHSSVVDNVTPEAVSSSEIEEVETPFNSARSRITETSFDGSLEIEFRGLDHADRLGIVSINCRARCLINWLVNALLSLKHPDSATVLLPLVMIYGPKVKFERGPTVAFNVFDWKGEKIDPVLVQKLADRNNISLTCGFLQHIWFSDKYKEWERTLETRTSVAKGTESRRKRDDRRGLSVVTVSLGFLTNFEDVYRLWAFISRFLDADFVEKERWRYTALNQETVEVHWQCKNRPTNSPLDA
ncbi:molybdenum cofactor sulfurase-like isoform X3 [Rhodamnia argentea]|uniref:Molybdenum cofactor sulfurase-like isoform X3 n=1 Tax=Rhodamnia argentea TaxID=178133 RepID=A0ABM3H7X2_9MYRT|nr:molybdenum cofactor sulfurase-like isoform X3 [Rhodamnia argentea]